MSTTSKKGGKGRKFGRNLKSPSMKAYHAEGREAKNRKRRVRRHVKAHPNDAAAAKVLAAL